CVSLLGCIFVHDRNESRDRWRAELLVIVARDSKMTSEYRRAAAELEALLSETPDHASRRAEEAFDDLAAGKADRIVLFGAGGLGRRTLAGLRKLGKLPLAFADNNPTAWGT